MDDMAYAQARSALLAQADALKDQLDARTIQDEHHQLYNYLEMNLFHFLGLSQVEERHQATRAAFASLMLTRNIDHTPEFAPCFASRIQIDDPHGVLSADNLRKPRFFCGFHTGPYWTLFKALVSSGSPVAAIFPPGLERKRSDVRNAFDTMVAHQRSDATLEFINLSDRKFLLHARRCAREGKQFVVFLDGYGGYLAPPSERDHAFNFLGQSITVKTSIVRLAAALGVECVPFNASRNEGMGRTLHVGSPVTMQRRMPDAAYASATEALFKVLEDHLHGHPFDWEGWVYFNAFLSKDDEISGGPGDAISWKQRYFQIESVDGARFIDKQTRKVFRLVA